MSKIGKSNDQGHEPEAGAARPQHESGAAPASGWNSQGPRVRGK
jgi:hypothetical protein